MLFRTPVELPLQIDSPFEPTNTFHFISLGAGVQSTVLYLMATQGLIQPMPTAAIFADTQWEPAFVYQHLAWLQSLKLSIPIHRITAGNLYKNTWNASRVTGNGHTAFTDIPTVVLDDDGNPAMRHRQCTTNYKVKPIIKHLKSCIGRKPHTRKNKPPYAVQWMGITTDEWMRCKNSKDTWIHNAYPLIDANMTRHDCLEWFHEQYPGQPLAKSSCVGCPYHSNRDWLRLSREAPEQMQQTIELDHHLRTAARVAVEKGGKPQYLHPSGKPLDEVIQALDTADQLQFKMFDDTDNPFVNECDGHCGI